MIVAIESNSLFLEEDVSFHIILNVFSMEEAEDYIIYNNFVDIDNNYFRQNVRCRCCGCYHIFQKYEFYTIEDLLQYIDRKKIFVDPEYNKSVARVYDKKTGKSIKFETEDELIEMLKSETII